MRGTVLAISAMSMVAAAAVRAQDAGPYYVREGMVREIDPPITAVWDMQVEVMDDEGSFDPLLMSDAHWATLVERAQVLRAASARMAAAQSIHAVDPAGDLTEAPEGTDLAAIEARIAANPDMFRAMALSLDAFAAQLVAAAEARDAGEVTRLANDIQPVCKACHDVFWYPEEYQQ